MALTSFSNNCPPDCSDEFEFLALDTNQDCPFIPPLSQIGDVWFVPNGSDMYPFANWVDGGYTVLANPTAIDNTDTVNAFAKWITGIGEVAASEKVVFTTHKFQKVTIKRVFTLVLTIYNLSNEQYEFLRSLQCNPTNYTFFYGNSFHVYGKATGIIPTFTDVDFPLGAGEADVELATLTITWESKSDPERKSNPYSDSDSVS